MTTALVASELDTYGGTTVVANPESPSTQPVLETANIAGRTFRIQDRISDGDNVLEPTYTVAAGSTTIDTSTTEVAGNLFGLSIRARYRSRPASYGCIPTPPPRIALTLCS